MEPWFLGNLCIPTVMGLRVAGNLCIHSDGAMIYRNLCILTMMGLWVVGNLCIPSDGTVNFREFVHPTVMGKLWACSACTPGEQLWSLLLSPWVLLGAEHCPGLSRQPHKHALLCIAPVKHTHTKREFKSVSLVPVPSCSDAIWPRDALEGSSRTDRWTLCRVQWTAQSDFWMPGTSWDRCSIPAGLPQPAENPRALQEQRRTCCCWNHCTSPTWSLCESFIFTPFASTSQPSTAPAVHHRPSLGALPLVFLLLRWNLGQNWELEGLSSLLHSCWGGKASRVQSQLLINKWKLMLGPGVQYLKMPMK